MDRGIELFDDHPFMCACRTWAFWRVHGVFRLEALDSADLCVMLLRFREWPDAQMAHFVNYYRAGKPIIALLEQGVTLQSAAPGSVVYFDRLNPTAHETSLMNALQQIRNQQKWKKDLTALGWIAGIALGLVALGEVLGNEK